MYCGCVLVTFVVGLGTYDASRMRRLRVVTKSGFGRGHGRRVGRRARRGRECRRFQRAASPRSSRRARGGPSPSWPRRLSFATSRVAERVVSLEGVIALGLVEDVVAVGGGMLVDDVGDVPVVRPALSFISILSYSCNSQHPLRTPAPPAPGSTLNTPERTCER